jgi:hypothetical protein
LRGGGFAGEGQRAYYEKEKRRASRDREADTATNLWQPKFGAPDVSVGGVSG